MTTSHIDLSKVAPARKPTRAQVARFLRYEKKIHADPTYSFAFPEKDRVEFISILRGWLSGSPSVLEAFSRHA